MSSSSSSSSDSSDEKKRRRAKEDRRAKKKRRRKEEKADKEKASRHSEKKKKKKRRKENHHRSPSPAADKSALPSVMGATFAEESPNERVVQPDADSQHRGSVMGMQRPEEAAAEAERAQRIHRVWDASLGCYRSVRESGEVVEQSVSRTQQQAMMRAKARVVPQGPAAHQPATYTGKDKFPSQHPWFGFK